MSRFEPILAQPVALPAWRGGSEAGLKTKNQVLVFPSEQDSFLPPSREQRCKLSQQQGKQLKSLGSCLGAWTWPLSSHNSRGIPRDPCRARCQPVEIILILIFKHLQHVWLIASGCVLCFSGYLLLEFLYLLYQYGDGYETNTDVFLDNLPTGRNVTSVEPLSCSD